MLAAERRQIIAERLQAAGRVMVGELSGEFSVSEETIRRDLEWLESEGVAKRTYGGAVPCGGGKAPPPYAVRKNTNVEGKLVIAQLAAALAEAMERKNYGEDLIRAIFYGNLARLLQI